MYSKKRGEKARVSQKGIFSAFIRGRKFIARLLNHTPWRSRFFRSQNSPAPISHSEKLLHCPPRESRIQCDRWRGDLPFGQLKQETFFRFFGYSTPTKFLAAQP